jgi:DNA-binding CsgD family transcriptional regulator
VLVAPGAARARDELAEAIDRLHHCSELGEALSAVLGPWVPHDGWVLAAVDPASGIRVEGATAGSLPAAADAALAANELEGHDRIRFVDLARQPVPAGILGADRSGDRGSFRLHELMEPEGFGAELRVALRERGALSGVLVLLRRDDVPAFRWQDAQLLTRASTPLIDRLRAPRPRSRPTEPSAPPGVVVLDAGGQVEAATAVAREWFGRLGTPADKLRTPRPVYEVSHRARHGVASPSVVHQLRDGGWVAISAEVLDDERTAVTLRTPTPTELLPAFARRFRYTPREEQITGLLLHGKATKQIARQLHLTTRTVEFHLDNLYRKTHVTGREELIAQLAT